MMICTVGVQGELQIIEGEITQLRDNNQLQRKRLMEAVSSVLKDLGEVGGVFRGELKVAILRLSLYCEQHLIEMTMELVSWIYVSLK